MDLSPLYLSPGPGFPPSSFDQEVHDLGEDVLLFLEEPLGVDDPARAAGANSAADSAIVPAHEAARRALLTPARDLAGEGEGMDILSRAVGIRTIEVADGPFQHLDTNQASDVGTTDGSRQRVDGAQRTASAPRLSQPARTER